MNLFWDLDDSILTGGATQDISGRVSRISSERGSMRPWQRSITLDQTEQQPVASCKQERARGERDSRPQRLSISPRRRFLRRRPAGPGAMQRTAAPAAHLVALRGARSHRGARRGCSGDTREGAGGAAQVGPESGVASNAATLRRLIRRKFHQTGRPAVLIGHRSWSRGRRSWSRGRGHP